MDTLITAPILIIAAAFFGAVGIVWMLFPFILLKRIDKMHREIADLNSKTKHPPIVAARPITKSAKDDMWAKAQAEG